MLSKDWQRWGYEYSVSRGFSGQWKWFVGTFYFFLLVNFLIQRISKRIVHNMGTRCLKKYFGPLNSMYHWTGKYWKVHWEGSLVFILLSLNTIKLLEKNIGRTLFDINFSNIFWINLLRQNKKKAKIDKWNLIRLSIAQETIEKMKRQPMEWKNIFCQWYDQ